VPKSFFALVSKTGLFAEPAGPAASTAYIVPVTSAAVNPIPAPVAGLKPTSPVIAEVGTLVMFGVPARIAKVAAQPSGGETAASGRAETLNEGPANERTITRMIEIVRTFSLCILFGLLRNKRPTKKYRLDKYR
jgi:hypothetical protein